MDEDTNPLLAKLNMLDTNGGGDPGGDRHSSGEQVELIEKARSPLRWPVLVLACLMLVGSYYCFDIPSALKTQINEYMQESSSKYETDFALMYTLYAAPNTILPFFGGYFVDRFGVCTCLIVFTSLIAAGQVIFTVGFLLKSWPIILLGRFVFALGGENLIVANSALLADWFKGTELAFSFGVNLSIARVGSVVNNILSPSLAHSVGLIFSLWFGAMTCAASVICVILTVPIDRKLNLEIAAQKAERDSRLLSPSRSSIASLENIAVETAKGSLERTSIDKSAAANSLLGLPVPSWLNIIWPSSATGERLPLHTTPPRYPGLSAGAGGSINSDGGSAVTATGGAPLGEDAVSPLFLGGTGQQGAHSTKLHHRSVGGGGGGGSATDNAAGLLTDKEREKISLGAPGSGGGGTLSRAEFQDPTTPPMVQWRDVFALPYVFWVLTALCVAMYGSVLPFNNVASSLLLERNYFIAPSAGCHLQYSGQCQSDPYLNPPVNCTNMQLSNYQPPLPINIVNNGEQLCHGQQVGDLGPQCLKSDVDCTNSEWYTSSGSPPGCAQEYCSRFIDAVKNAAWVMSIPYTISGVVSPVIGLLIDRYGKRAIIATIAAALVIVVHVMLGYTDASPVGPLVGQGLAYTGFAAVLWPAVPLVIQPRLTGLGFGILTASLNAGCAVLPIIVAQVYNDSASLYIPNVELMFALLGVLALSLGLYLNYYDFYHGHVLNRGAEPKGGWKTDEKYELVQQDDA